LVLRGKCHASKTYCKTLRQEPTTQRQQATVSSGNRMYITRKKSWLGEIFTHEAVPDEDWCQTKCHAVPNLAPVTNVAQVLSVCCHVLSNICQIPYISRIWFTLNRGIPNSMVIFSSYALLAMRLFVTNHV
jgi:hypothetical protein